MDKLAQYADWAYLIGAILFILTLRGLSSPATAIMGNRYGMMGMALAVFSSFFVADNPNVALILSAMVIGAGIGIFRARTVPMTQMPETVAMMHSLVGLAAVFIAIAAVLHEGVRHDAIHRFELFIGCFIGAITFSASVFAYGKLAAKKWAKSLTGNWVKVVQATLALVHAGIRHLRTSPVKT
jgi:NAD(P) transhydrogenase subunit beta